MGISKKRKQKFLKENPYCCFCGGATKSEEPDHIPSRSLFNRRQWPEGFEFPACSLCNRETRSDEQVVAFLSRVFPNPKGEQYVGEFTKLCESIAHYRQDIVEELSPSLAQKKLSARKHNMYPGEGQTTNDLPLLHLGPLVNEAVLNFSRKLIMALYYKHAGKILPHSAGIGIRWYTNADILNGALPDGLSRYLEKYPNIQRCKIDLQKQFNYGFAFSENRRMSVFLVNFRLSFSIVGAVNLDAKKLELPGIQHIYGPYEREPHPQSTL